MADDDLIKLARAHRIGTHYVDWRGRDTEVSPDTIVAVLAAMGVDASTPGRRREHVEAMSRRHHRRLPETVVHSFPPGSEVPVIQAGGSGSVEVRVELAGGGRLRIEPDDELRYLLPPDLPGGWHRLGLRGDGHAEESWLAVVPARLPTPPRTWGLVTQLYSVRSAGSWGLGDLRDLADLADWSARELGAGFILVNPMHAAEPAVPVSPSPYLPMSRRFAAPFYLRVEDVREMAVLGPDERTRVAALASAASASNRTLDPLDRDACWAAKGEALELLHRAPRSQEREEAYKTFREREGDSLTVFATWCALAEEHGPDWRTWPAALHGPAAPQVAEERLRLADRIDYHAWLQWHLDQQLDAAQRGAREAGMPVGVIHDLAIGVHPGGADGWMHQSMFATGASAGAPPDEFNQRGQDWGQSPWHPFKLAQAGYGPFRETLSAVLRHGGGLRLDHAMQMSRLWWIPQGAPPDQGTYVSYDKTAMMAALLWEVHRADGLVVGEDLGTVEPGLRDGLRERGVLGTSLLWFERDEEGKPRRPERWRELSLATVGTHDMPPITGFLHGDHIELRQRLGLLTRPVYEELADHRRQLTEWLTLLDEEGLLTTPPAELVRAFGKGSREHDAEVVAALHAFLARTPARLLGISLADAVGERRTQNQPGTSDEYPNWRVPLADAECRPVLLEALRTNPAVRKAVAPVAKSTHLG